MATINQNEKTDYSAMKISYTDKDYTNILDDLINSIPGITEKWVTTDENDPGMVLVKLMSMLGDMLFYTQDMQSLEVYPNSVTQRKNAATIYKLIGYKMKWYRSATLEANVVNTYTNSATLPRFCTFTTADGSITYTTWDLYDLPSNTTNNGLETSVELIQGTPITPSRSSNNPYADPGKPWHSIYGYNYTVNDIINNRIYLKNNNIDQDHIILIDDQNEEWELKENIYLTTAVGRFFEFGIDANDNAYIELVDYYDNFNVNKFKIFYIQSSGEDGQVYANTLTNITGNVWSRINNIDTFTVYNVSNFIHFTHYSSTLGYNPETPDEARKESVKYQNTLDTLITLADFERATLREPGVANVRATDLTNDPGVELTYYVGDINQDGKIDNKDLELLNNYLADKNKHPLTTYQQKLADINQDGKVDGDDLACLREFVEPTKYYIGDIDNDGAITNKDLTLLQKYVANPSTSSLTDFQKRLCDINQDGKVDATDVTLLQNYLKTPTANNFGYLIDVSKFGECGTTTITDTQLLDGFIVKLYILRTEEYENIEDETYSSVILSDLQEYKILPLTIQVDLHSISKYYWTIEGKFLTKQPLSRDELQTIMVNINNDLKYKYSVSKVNFNSLINYKDVIETILDVDNRILMVDLEPITYYNEEGLPVDKIEVTGDYTETIPRLGTLEDGTDDTTIPDAQKLDYTFTLPNTPLLPGSVMIRINDGQYTLRDNNNGTIYNIDNILAHKGTIDYVTGEVHLQFNAPLVTDMIIDYTKNKANIAVYKNLSTQKFYFDSSALEADDMQDLV